MAFYYSSLFFFQPGLRHSLYLPVIVCVNAGDVSHNAAYTDVEELEIETF